MKKIKATLKKHEVRIYQGTIIVLAVAATTYKLSSAYHKSNSAESMQIIEQLGMTEDYYTQWMKNLMEG